MPTLPPGRIRHTVVFTPKHAEGSPEESDFLAAGAALSSIPGVEAFEVLREVSPKNGYRYGFSMVFADRDAYEGYNEHPNHVAFVRDRWDAEIADFLEIDYEVHGA
jgi:heme-degrading monooxygenase HmoA